MNLQPIVAFRQQLQRATSAAMLQPMVADTEKTRFAELFNAALDDFADAPKGRKRRSWVANKWGVSVETARKWLVGEAIPQTSKIPGIAADIHTTAAVLLGMEMKKAGDANVIQFDRSKSIEIPRFAVQGSMGTGIPLPDMETITSSIIVNPEWVRTQLRNITSAGNLAIITGYGDSMEPTFTDGSQLIVDRGVNDVKVDSVYVVQYNHQLFIKRLQRRLDGSILMISDNSKYQPEAIKNDDGCVFIVLGRVVGTWNFTKL